MDELDRLYRRLLQNIRNGYPEYLTHPFEISEIYQHLVPYRHNRRELEIETSQDYEFALCRLLSGERGYLVGDPAMQAAAQREIAAPNANTGIFREFAASRVSLSPDAPRIRMRTDERTSGETAAASSTPPGAPAVERPPATPPRRPMRPRPSSPVGPVGTIDLPPDAAAAPPAPPSGGGAGATAPATPARRAPVPHSADAEEPSATAAGAADSCRYCDGVLPSGRRVVFCPHCGQNLTVQRCPACGTELEVSWKFCVTCGRGVAGHQNA